MKISTLALFVCLMVFSASYSQTPRPDFPIQKAFGTTSTDDGSSIVSTPDGGYVLAGAFDALEILNFPIFRVIGIAKLNSAGDLIWQRYLPLSVFTRSFPMIKNTPDGGFIVIGSSGEHASPQHHGGDYDVYVAKLDSNGLVQWEKLYGGSAQDVGADIIPLAGGGYMFLAHTYSTDGDVSGNHGDADLWLVNIDDFGNIRWQQQYGSAGREFAAGEYGNIKGALQQTSDGGFILLGAILNAPFINYNHDVYITKVTAGGNITWQRKFEGKSFDLKQTTDGGYIVLSASTSGPTSDDFAMTRLEADGTTRWSKVLTYKGFDTPASLLIDADGGFIVAGSVDVESGIPDHNGLRDGLVFKMKDQSDGEIVWQSKPIGGETADRFSQMVFGTDGKLAITGSKGGNANSAPTSDVWFLKAGGTNIIKGTVYIDNNLNGVRDAGDLDAKNFLVRSKKDGETRDNLTINGQFKNITDSGTFTTTVVLRSSNYKIVPSSKQTIFTSSYGNVDSMSFALQPVPGIKDYGVSLTAIDRVRPGFTIQRILQVYNDGSEILANREAVFIKDRMTFLSATPAPSSINGDTVKWMIPLLNQGDAIDISIKLKVDNPPGVDIGDAIIVKAAIDSAGDIHPSNNLAVLREIATGSFDPNDKMENSGKYITRLEAENEKELTYTIRFQNKGTDTAFNIKVLDTLSANVDWASLKMVAASHSYTLNVINGNKLSWSFDNILLAHEGINEPASHGFITYRIKTKKTLVPGDTIKNSASIYFDFNPPVRTNTFLTIVKEILPGLITPFVQGVLPNYCETQGVQRGKINNLPATASGIITVVKLNGNALNIAADSTFSFNVSVLGAGNHVTEVTFFSPEGTKTTAANFIITASVTPDVNVSANTSSNPIVITATNAAGGGQSPLYTFAKNRTFTDIIQPEGMSATLTLNPTSLKMGENWMYVRMKTSADCFSQQVAIDSVRVTRFGVTGLTDPDFPGQLISVTPNPYKNQITVYGLNAAKSYTIRLYNLQGKSLYKTKVVNRQNVTLNWFAYAAGNYLLSFYDEKSKKLIGTLKIVKQ